jgi:hypothetical protein
MFLSSLGGSKIKIQQNSYKEWKDSKEYLLRKQKHMSRCEVDSKIRAD